MKNLIYAIITIIVLAIIGISVTDYHLGLKGKVVGASVCTVAQGCTGTTTFAQNSFLFGNVGNAVGATSSPFFTNFSFVNATETNATVTVIHLNNVVASSTLSSDPNGDITYIPNGSANQVLAMNTGGTQAVYKTIAAVANETTVASNNTQINIGIVDPLIGSKGGTGIAAVNVNQILFGSITNTWAQSANLTFDTNNFSVASGTPRFMISDGGDLGATNIYLASSTFVATSTINHNLYFGTASSTIVHTYMPKANATYGTTTLSSGSATVNTTRIRTAPTSTVFMTLQNCVACGSLYVSSITNGTSFVVGSTNVLDGSEIAWWIINPL